MPPNSADAMALYDSGDVDFVLDAGETEGAVEASSAVVKTVLVNQMATSLSESVRQAMSMVIDRNALAELAGGEDEVFRAADGLIPDGITTSQGESFRQANGRPSTTIRRNTTSGASRRRSCCAAPVIPPPRWSI